MNSSTSSREGLIEQLHQQFRELSARTILFHHWISELLELNTLDHKCLDIIVNAKSPITGVQLSSITGLSSGAITGVIDRLEKAKYVSRERDLKDRRVVYIKPNMEKIEKDIVPIFRSMQEIMTEVYSSYSDKELVSILDTASKFNQLMKERTSEIMGTISQRKRGKNSQI